VKISEDVDETEDEGREADAKRGDTSGEFANHTAAENGRKKAAAKEKKKGGSGKKKRKDSKDGGVGVGGDTSKLSSSDHRLTKTISGRRLLLNGSKSTKPQHGDDSPTGTDTDATRVVCVSCVSCVCVCVRASCCVVLTLWGESGFRKTFSLVDVRSFFKRDAKEDKEDKVVPKRDDPGDGKKKKKDKKVPSFTRAVTPRITLTLSRFPFFFVLSLFLFSLSRVWCLAPPLQADSAPSTLSEEIASTTCTALLVCVVRCALCVSCCGLCVCVCVWCVCVCVCGAAVLTVAQRYPTQTRNPNVPS
jgi:hypothetical protein